MQLCYDTKMSHKWCFFHLVALSISFMSWLEHLEVQGRFKGVPQVVFITPADLLIVLLNLFMQVLCANAATFILKGWWKRHIHLVKACKINSLIRALFWSPMVNPCLLSESHLLCNMHLNAYWSVNINTDTVHSRSRRLYSVCTQQHQ